MYPLGIEADLHPERWYQTWTCARIHGSIQVVNEITRTSLVHLCKLYEPIDTRKPNKKSNVHGM